MNMETKLGSAEAAERIQASVNVGELHRALDLSLEALSSGHNAEAVLSAASGAWVAAVDAGDVFDAFDEQRAKDLQQILILQRGCDVSPPIFAHRIAAQHSAGIAGHLGRAAKQLEHTLFVMLAEDVPAPNAVLLAMLLRDGLPTAWQGHISALHLKAFPQFDEGQLRIPYSVVFDRASFRRNVADLDKLARQRGERLLDGSLSLVHLLVLLWLVPAAVDDLEDGWHQRAIDARKGQLTDEEEGAVRSLLIRFGGGRDAREIALAEAFADAQRKVWSACDGSGGRALSRLDSKPSQLAAVARNQIAARLPLPRAKRRRPRVALCISGQLRGFRASWPTWAPLLSGADVTVFVHTWKNVGRGTPEPFRYVLPFEGANFCREYRSIGMELGPDELRRRYPALYGDFASSSEVTAAEISAFYDTPHVHVDDEADPRFADFTNPEKMYWKVERCFELVERSGETFDAVIRIRPDKPIDAVAFSWSDMMEALHARPLLFCETAFGVHYGALLMGDQFALGLPQTSAIYAHSYSAMQEPMAMGLHKLEPVLSGHSTFAQACWLSAIDVRKVPIKFGPFAEIEPMRANAIQSALARDTADRMDDVDRRFIAAIDADVLRFRG